MVEAKKQIEGMKKTYLSWSLRDYDARMEARIEGRNEGIAIGEKRGRTEGIREAARNMIAKHYPVADIAEITGLSLAEVEQLAAQG